METKHYILSETTSSAVGVLAAWKIVAGLFGLGIVATVLGFMVAWPKTGMEALARVAATMAGSTFCGPLFAIWAYHKWPLLFSAGIEFAQLLGAGELSQIVGIGMVATPFVCMAGLPFWWVLGVIAATFRKIKDKDLGEVISIIKLRP